MFIAILLEVVSKRVQKGSKRVFSDSEMQAKVQKDSGMVQKDSPPFWGKNFFGQVLSLRVSLQKQNHWAENSTSAFWYVADRIVPPKKVQGGNND